MSNQTLASPPGSDATEPGTASPHSVLPSLKLIERRCSGRGWGTTRLMVEAISSLIKVPEERAAFKVGFRCGVRRALEITGDKT